MTEDVTEDVTVDPTDMTDALESVAALRSDLLHQLMLDHKCFDRAGNPCRTCTRRVDRVVLPVVAAWLERRVP